MNEEDSFTIDDALCASDRAVQAAQQTHALKPIRASAKAKGATLEAMRDCTEMSQDAAIRAHNHAARMHYEALGSPNHKRFHFEAKEYHEISIRIHEVIKTRFIRARR